VNECKPLADGVAAPGGPRLPRVPTEPRGGGAQNRQATSDKSQAKGRVHGLTLVHFSAQRKRCLWDRGCIEVLYKGCEGLSGGMSEYMGCILCQKRLRLS
jgi:hypothetical protein